MFAISFANKVRIEMEFLNTEVPFPSPPMEAFGCSRNENCGSPNIDFPPPPSEEWLCQKRRLNSTKIKKLVEFFEEFIKKNKENRQKVGYRLSCPTAYGTLKSVKSDLALDNKRGELSSQNPGQMHIHLKRTRSVDIISPAFETIAESPKKSNIEEEIDVLGKVVERETAEDPDTSYSGVIGSQEVYQDIKTKNVSDESMPSEKAVLEEADEKYPSFLS